jgi:hypothetical protein
LKDFLFLNQIKFYSVHRKNDKGTFQLHKGESFYYENKNQSQMQNNLRIFYLTARSRNWMKQFAFDCYRIQLILNGRFLSSN